MIINLASKSKIRKVIKRKLIQCAQEEARDKLSTITNSAAPRVKEKLSNDNSGNKGTCIC